MNIINFFRNRWAEVLPVLLFLLLAVVLNLQFLDGSNINYGFSAHDEYLTVRQVYSILHPLSLKHFFMAIISGDVLYYGRLVFYSDAIVAFLPERLFGIAGMVFAIRMFHTLLLAGALWLLATTFIENKGRRVIFLVGSLFLYYSLYFSVVPKPEPHQLFLLALFFRAFVRSGFRPGRHFLWLGAAYGVKFNVLIILPVIALFLLPVFRQEWKRILGSAVWFIGGIIVAVPCLLLSLLRPVFLQTYIQATFGNTANVDDSASVVASDWLGHVWPTYYTTALPFLLLFFTMLAFVLYREWLGKKFDILRSPVLLMILCGLALNIPIVLLTKRLYPHYLWTGVVFLWLSLCMAEIAIFGNYVKVILSVLAVSASGYLLINLQELVRREESSAALKKEAINAYDLAFKRHGDKATVLIDISVYYPFQWYLETNRYHPFSGPRPGGNPSRNVTWTSQMDSAISSVSPDVVLLGNLYSRKLESATDVQSISVKKYLAAKYDRIAVNSNLSIFEKRK